MKKKVLVVYSSDISTNAVGGIKNYICEFTKNRGDLEVDLLAICNGEPPSDIPFNTIFRIKAVQRPFVVTFVFKVWLLYLRNKIMFIDYDVVIFNRHEEVLLYLLFPRTKKILLVHGSILYGFKFWPLPVALMTSFLEKLLVPLIDITYVLLRNTEFGVPYYKIRHHKYADKICYAPVPIAEEFISYHPDKKQFQLDELKIIYFGRIVNNPKNVFLLPNYAMEFLSRGIKVIISVAGDGPDLNALVERVNELNLQPNFSFLGALDIAELPRVVAGNDMSIILSKFEGTCMSALESLALRVPVAAFPVGDIPEYLIDMENGVLISEVDSVSTNVDKMIEFIDTYRYRESYSNLIQPYYPDNCFSHIDI